MREAIGGAWMYGIVITFMLIFTAYLCISINYTAAYKVSDSIINQIKKDNGVNHENIDKILQSLNYNSSGNCDSENNDTGWTAYRFGSSEIDTTSNIGNYCLKKVEVSKASSELPTIVYYRVKVFYNIDVPIISNFTFAVKGDSKNIYSPINDYIPITNK